MPEVRVAMYGDLVEPLCPEAGRALDDLRQALNSVQRGLTTKPGRMVLIDNRVVLHARAPFSPRYDGKDRWLQRLLVTDSLWPLRAWQREAKRVLTP